jgi:peroxiredoxin
MKLLAMLRSIGGRPMPALTTGKLAPDFTLPNMKGEQFSLSVTLTRSPVLLAFFKVSCPVCQFAFPYLERIYKAYGGKGVTIAGISQNQESETARFVKQFGVTFPVLLEDTRKYPVSNAYGLTNVPSLFWVNQDGKIEISSVGWVKKEIEQINQRAAEAGNLGMIPVFHAGEQVADFRAG